MNPEFWHERWRLNEIGFHQPVINPYLENFWSSLAIAADSQVFVPLCGKSRDLLWLQQQGHQVLGVELSPVAVSDFFAEQALSPYVENQGRLRQHTHDRISLLEGDFFALNPAHLTQVAAVYDRAALIALPPALRSAYVAHLVAILPDTVPMLLVTMDYDQEQMAGPPFAVDDQEVVRHYSPHYQITLLAEADLLAGPEATRWRNRGITRMTERVYYLEPLNNR